MFRPNPVYMSLLPLIQQSLEFQQSPEGLQNRQNTTKKHYVLEHCTIRLHGPRQSGHTRAILSLLHDLKQSPLIVCQPKSKLRGAVKHCFTFQDLTSSKTQGLGTHCVIVDDFSRLDVAPSYLIDTITEIIEFPFSLILLG